MRITNINLANFRAFAAPPNGIDIPLPKGENLLVYGENGAGKSSLFLALKNFFEASAYRSTLAGFPERHLGFSPFKNKFNADQSGWVRLNFSDFVPEDEKRISWAWGDDCQKESPDSAILEANACKGFIDYKALLQTHFLTQNEQGINRFHRLAGKINFFPILIGSPPYTKNIGRFGLLGSIVNPITGDSYYEHWMGICISCGGRRTQKWKDFMATDLANFNNGLRDELAELSKLASTYLQFFGYNIKFEFEFGGLAWKEKFKLPVDDIVQLHLEYFDTPIPNHHEFLNEAKLSALALSIFLAAHKRQPAGAIKVLAFDDVLIGLDMSNRLPFLDLLKEHFSDYQIILTTYDRAWFEIVRARTLQGDWPHNWKTIEMFVGKTEDFESPVVKTDEKSLLQLANEFFEAHLYKAAAVYARTHFEHLLKSYCSEKGLAVKYHENPKKISSNDFWSAIKSKQATEYELVERRNGKGDLVKTENKAYQVPLVGADLVRQVEEARDLFLNPLSHSNIVNPIASEIKKALEAIEALEARLANA